jgi:hypothetical protein
MNGRANFADEMPIEGFSRSRIRFPIFTILGFPPGFTTKFETGHWNLELGVVDLLLNRTRIAVRRNRHEEDGLVADRAVWRRG